MIIFWAGMLCAQPLSYTRLDPGAGPHPEPRVDGAIVYDSAEGRVLMFGGSASAGVSNDLWSYSLAQRRWTELRPDGDKPPARLGHTAVFDTVRRQMLIFGGQASGFFNDTWAYDLARNRWSRLAAGGGAGPSRRYGHSGIYDAARDRMIVSHGFTDAGRFDDTWALDLSTGTWRDISPARGRPLRRCLHHAAYDAAGQQMLLYGGCASGAGPCPLGDLWSFDLVAGGWTELTGSGRRPPPRDHYGLAFDSVRRRMVVFGGAGPGNLNDTWEFDPASRLWSETALAGAAPAARSRHQGTFADGRGVAFFFGGASSAGPGNELWMLGPGLAPPAQPEVSRAGVVNAFSGQVGRGVAPGEIVSVYGSGLGPLEGVSLGLDPGTGRLPVSGPGVSVTFNGIAAPLYFVSAAQLNVQVPYELQGAAEASIRVNVNGTASEAVAVPVLPTAPGLFPRAFDARGVMVGGDTPAAPGDVVVLYATGQGVTSPASVTGAIPTAGVFAEPIAPLTLTIGGVAAEVLFKGQAPGTAGVMQLNVRVPAGLGRGDAPVTLRVGDADSQTGVSIPIR